MTTRLANAEEIGPDAIPPATPFFDGPPDPAWYRQRRIVVRQQPALPPAGSPYPVPEPRPAVFEQPAFTWRPGFGLWQFDSFTGAHGVVNRFGTPAQQNAGGMNPWDMQRRTLRSSPVDAWDAGTAVGRSAV